ncbi:YdaU family protein [Salipiger thiooxidans]|uniref:YdaU family protein n=1 Tax=Salipiger thiooxidans TaxID=282683 RepID=UPI001CD75E7D|nr:YdaU family protein [Salipiger thiooxidans]MCA0846100.1 YdaU family protein [Salipiger thiooxidans]
MTDEKGKHYAFYPSDWLAGTRGLTAAETGVYITLIAMMYEREGPLDMDRARLARLCGIPAGSFKKAVQVLIEEGKIVETDGGLWNARVPKEIEKTHRKINAGKAGADARWQSDERENLIATSQSGKQNMSRHMSKKDNKNNENDLRSQCGRNATQNQNQNTTAAMGRIGSGKQHRSSSDGVDDRDFTADERPTHSDGEARSDDELYDEVLSAAGIRNGSMPTYWMPPSAVIHVGRWRSQLGLTDAEIISTVRECRKRHDNPPNGPKGLDSAMQRTAGAKVTELKPRTASQHGKPDEKSKRMAFYASITDRAGATQ